MQGRLFFNILRINILYRYSSCIVLNPRALDTETDTDVVYVRVISVILFTLA